MISLFTQARVLTLQDFSDFSNSLLDVLKPCRRNARTRLGLP